MDGIEQAIRNALAKGDAEDPAFREKVYRSAAAALDRSMKERPDMTVEYAIRRRKALKATIGSIESEFVPALPRDAAPAALELPVIDPADRRGPEVAPPPRPAYRQRSRASRARGKGGVLRGLVAMLLVLAVLAGGGWYAYSNLDTLVQWASGQLQTQSADGASPPALSVAGAGDEASWTRVFQPEDIHLVETPPDGQATSAEEEGTNFLRLRTGASGAPAGISVGQGILERLAGRRVVFNIVARAGSPETGTQMAVECDFAGMGDCGRTRYALGASAEDHLFEVHLPDAMPARTGAILVTSDVEGQGREVDILAVRVRVAD